MAKKDYSYLANLGKSKDLFQGSNNDPLLKFVEEFAKDLVNSFREKVEEFEASGQLKASFRPEIEVIADKVSFAVIADSYWEYVNYGVSGTKVKRNTEFEYTKKMPPVKDMLDFQATKSIPLPQKFKTREQFAFAMAKNIKKKGIEGKHFFEEVVNKQMIDDFKRAASILLGRAIELNISNKFK